MVAHLKSKLIPYDRPPGLVDGSMFASNDEGERLRYAGYALHRRTAEAMTCRAELDTALAAAGDQPGNRADDARRVQSPDRPRGWHTAAVIDGPARRAVPFPPASPAPWR